MLKYITEKPKPKAVLNLTILFAGIFLFFPPFRAFAEENKSNIVYFYLTGCASCEKANELLKEGEGKLTVDRYNANMGNGAALFQAYCDKYNVPEDQRIIPAVFAGSEYFIGYESIAKGLEGYIITANYKTELLSSTEYTDALIKRFGSFNLLGAVITGILNGLNPCSLSILILLATLITARELKIMQYGISYCTGKLLAYFGIGTVFFTFFSGIGVEKYLFGYRLIMTAVCIFFIVFNFTDFLAARREDYGRIRLQLPVKLKGLNFDLIKHFGAVKNKTVLLGVCFTAGAITSVGEFFCTGQIYVATILSMIHNIPSNRSRALLFLFLYCVGFILPFLTVTLALHKGAEYFDVSDFIRRHTPHIKLFNMVIFIGILIFVWFF